MRKSVDPDIDLFSDEVVSQLSAPVHKTIAGEDLLCDKIAAEGFAADPKFPIRMEAFLLQLAHANNKILSLSNSRTRILAHQVESTHRIVNALNQRFMIADEVGLGKTIEAGLVIKELIFRYRYSRILIVAPASLLVQWQHEMEEKFSENFEIIDRSALRKIRKKNGDDVNPWSMVTHGICSIDFVKSPSVIGELEAVRWDAVVIDEAHRLRRDVQVSTRAYNVGEVLTAKARSVLLLTATPFRGKIEELFFLIRLVDRNLLGPVQSFVQDYCSPDADLSRLREKLSGVVIRRTKKEVGGFTRRHARTIRFDLYPEELALYEETTRYVAEEFNRALATENRAIGFVMTVFQKLLDSSSYALKSALGNRRAHLHATLEKADLYTKSVSRLPDDPDDDDIDFSDYEDPSSIVIDAAKKTAAEIREEIATLDRLLSLASSVTRNKKGEKLLEMIDSMKQKGVNKFLIFTQFRTTQDYLAGILSGYDVELFNGSMDKDQKENAIIRFSNEAEILVCTEAGGEGRNMQFCSVLFNYDLPWSPLKVEQRIGRIHRFGQKNDVAIYNFSTKGTVAERVLDVLERKLHLFEESIGTPDILLGQIEDEAKLSTLFMELSSGKRSRASIEKEIDISVARARESYEKLSELTVARRMDFNYDEYYRITQKERVFSNKQLERFFEGAYRVSSVAQRCLGKKNTRNSLYPILGMPDEARHHQYGSFNSESALARSDIEFLAFGHPIVDGIINECCHADFGGMTGVIYLDDYSFDGAVFYYVVTFHSVAPMTELVPIAVGFQGAESDSLCRRVERECARIAPRQMDEDRQGSTPHIINFPNPYELFRRARTRLERVISDRIMSLRESLDLSIDPETEKIRNSYSRLIEELTSKLERQELQMIHFERDMKGAVSRTRNRIAEALRERDAALASNQKRLGLDYSLELAGIGICEPMKRS